MRCNSLCMTILQAAVEGGRIKVCIDMTMPEFLRTTANRLSWRKIPVSSALESHTARFKQSRDRLWFWWWGWWWIFKFFMYNCIWCTLLGLAGKPFDFLLRLEPPQFFLVLISRYYLSNVSKFRSWLLLWHPSFYSRLVHIQDSNLPFQNGSLWNWEPVTVVVNLNQKTHYCVLRTNVRLLLICEKVRYSSGWIAS